MERLFETLACLSCRDEGLSGVVAVRKVQAWWVQREMAKEKSPVKAGGFFREV